MQYLLNKISRGLTILLVLLTFIAATVVAVVYYFNMSLPNYTQLVNYTLPTVSRVYSADHKLIAEYAYEHRIFTPIAAIPQRVINAVIAIEDKNFYTNAGIDILGITHAALDNLLHIFNKQQLRGGSTITQQVVKNFLLNNEKTLSRKIKEAILAFKINQVFSKEHIMELYLNKIYFGHSAYGITSAALRYFNKPLDKLTTEEAALLAALPKAPSKLDPTRNYAAALRRRNSVLERMYLEHMLSKREYLHAKNIPIILNTSYTNYENTFPFFTEEVRRILVEKYGKDTLYTGGLTINTTLIPEYQRLAQRVLRKKLIEYDRGTIWHGVLANYRDDLWNWHSVLKRLPLPKGMESDWQMAMILHINDERIRIGLRNNAIGYIPVEEFAWAKNDLHRGDVVLVSKREADYRLEQIPQVNGAIVVMEVKSGKVLTLVGGYDYAVSQFNIATQAMRQPGSVFKPFVYLAALENGFTPTTIINDEEIVLSQGVNLPPWIPNNYEKKFFGPTSMRIGLEMSRNIIAIQIARTIGLNRILAVAKRFDIYKHVNHNFSTVLGTAETTLLSLTTAYAMLANSGLHLDSIMMEEIRNAQGKIIFPVIEKSTEEGAPEKKRIASAVNTYQITSMLQGAIQRGTGRRARILKHTLAGKTGTSDNGRDAWFIAFTPQIAIGVYVGYDTPKSLGKKATGSRVALPIFLAFAQEFFQDKLDTPFAIPKDIAFVKIDEQSGLLASKESEHAVFEAFGKDKAPLESNTIYYDLINKSVEE